MRPVFLLIALTGALSAQEPFKKTTEGRLWLKVPEGQPPLRDIQVSSGSATPAPWEKNPAVRERNTDVIFPVRWWDWKELTIRFTPAADGSMELVLTGPWEEQKAGTVFRKEVLWDNLTAEGAEIANGGFEARSDGAPDSWKAIHGTHPAATAEAMEGKFLAATWQNGSLSQTLHLKAGRQVTLKLHAKAATAPDFILPKRLGPDTPAHRALAAVKRGVNLGNCWDAPPPYRWGIRYTPEDIDRIAAQGFDHIRVPVAWHYHLKQGPAGPEIDSALLADLEPVLRRAIDLKLHVLLDWHHFHDLTNDPAAHRARFVASWETIARHFNTWPPALFLELLNEPRDALTTELVNPIHAETIAAIRRIDPERIIVVSPGNWGDIRELDKLRLPDTDDRIVVTVHCYEPFYFTHQGAGWVELESLKGITYPGPPQTPFALPESLKENSGVRAFIEGYNTLPGDRNPSSASPIRELLDLAHDWSVHFGRPVHLGEFGSHNIATKESRDRYSRDVRTLAESRKIPWALWDWKAGFAYWDSKSDQPLLRNGLFE
jgi:endoglucanase